MVTADQIMRTSVLSVNPWDTLDKVLNLFIQHKISGVPVVDENQKLVGMITERDLVNFTSQAHVISQFDSSGWISPHTKLEETVKIKKGLELINRTSVKKVMTQKVCSVSGKMPIQNVAVIMNRKKINHLPVVDDEKHVVGIITRSHLIRHMAVSG